MTWPVASQTYGSFAYLKREVGGLLGFGRNEDAWSHEQRGIAEAVVQRGVRNFYTPPPLSGEKYAHEWSFLRPLHTLTTSADDYDYDLGSDFVMFEGPMTFARDETVLYDPIEVISEFQLRQLQQDSSSTGQPSKAATRAKASDGGYEVLLWPTPDAEYNIEYRAKVNPSAMSSPTDVPYGGEQHCQTVLESCLAEAEAEAGKGELHRQRFLDRLTASVSLDRKVCSPEQLGYDSGGRERFISGDLHDMDANLVTYNGVTW